MLTLPRVYPIVDSTTLLKAGVSPVECAEAFLEGGAQILQFRHKTLWDAAAYRTAEAIAALCRDAGALFVLNDRADFAATLNAALHLGQEDLTPADARRVVGGDAVIGFSTHKPAQMTAAANEPVDYVAFGPVYGTASKERPDPTTGIEQLRIIRALTQRPLVAIGGITRANAQACWDAGADSVAVIADLVPLSSPNKSTLRDRMRQWQQLTAR
jgi:thiamine-phosphate pyrophosphorylase